MSLRLLPRLLSAAMLALFLGFLPFSAAAAGSAAASLTTLFASGNQYAGNMFNLTVLSANDIIIQSFDVNMTSAIHENASVSVSYRPGGYSGYEEEVSAWTLAGTASVQSNGLNVPMPVSVGDFTLAAGETYGIYITASNYTMPDIRMYYTMGSAAYQNDDLKLSGSIGRGTPDFMGSVIPGRIWNGTVCYTVRLPPIPTPTPAPLTMPETGDRAGACFRYGSCRPSPRRLFWFCCKEKRFPNRPVYQNRSAAAGLFALPRPVFHFCV